MPDRILDVRLFRFALAAAEHGSFRKAAVALNVQQSSVSRGVRNLEHRVGTALFERSHAGIRPTPAGERFLEEAALGFDHMKRAMQRADALHRGEHGELAVGLSVPFILLGDVFGQFRQTHGGITVEIIDTTTRTGWAWVQRRRVDIAFVAGPSRADTVQSRHLRDERIIAVLPATHRLASARRVELRELRDETFILSANGLGPDLHDHLMRRMAKWGVEPHLQFHRANLCNLLSMVAKGYGLTIVAGPLTCAVPDGVVLVPLAGRNIVSVRAIWMESNPNPALKGLLEILRKQPVVVGSTD